MSQTTVPSSIVSRIRKLLALANDGRGNENEATVAAEKAQTLMAEYNLEMSQIGNGASSAVDVEDAARSKENTGLVARTEWMQKLMSIIAENNFCIHWFDRDLKIGPTGRKITKRKHMLLGRKVNVLTAKLTYEYLVSAMERLCPYEDSRTIAYRSWFDGCTDRITSRLRQIRRENEAASRAKTGTESRGDGKSLALSDVYSSEDDLNWDFLYGYAPGTTAANRAKREQKYAEETEASKARAHATVVATAEKPETMAERMRQEKRDARWRARWKREEEYRESRMDRSAYASGSEAGKEIGLNVQVGSGAKPSTLV